MNGKKKKSLKKYKKLVLQLTCEYQYGQSLICG